jgi:hypothetical protein
MIVTWRPRLVRIAVRVSRYSLSTPSPTGRSAAIRRWCACCGNPPMGNGCMQRAAELNQPATAFLHDRQLRWFTPAWHEHASLSSRQGAR